MMSQPARRLIRPLSLAAALALASCGAPEEAADSHRRPDRLDGPAEVIFDQEGMAHIYAAYDDDVYFMQGYVTARDRLFQMDLLRRRAQGRRAEVLGEALVSSDKQSRALRFVETGDATLAALRQDDPEICTAMEAYAAGVSQYIDDALAGENGASLPPQFDALGYTPEPWTAGDTAAIEKLLTAGLAMRPDQDLTLGLIKLLLGGSTFADLYRFAPLDEAATVPDFLDTVSAARSVPRGDALRERTAAEAALDDASAEALLEALRLARSWNLSMGGSNNMVISGDRSASGHALLASDSHQGIEHPAVYYGVHLSTARDGGDLDAVGATFPGVPFVMFGHNRDIAWGPTTSIYDVSDAYLETMVGDDAVMFNGEEVPLEITEHTIAVAGGEDVTFEARHVPHHGPMMPTDGLPLPLNISLRWTGYEARSAARAFSALNRAEDFEGFRDALAHYFTGGMHWLYADVEGNIGYSSFTHVPLRDAVDPDTPPIALLPGEGGYEWQAPDGDGDTSYRYLSEDQVPWVYNPARGYLATANNDPVGQTHDNDPFNDALYLSGVFDVGTRAYQPARRFEALLAEDGSVSYDELISVQLDTGSRVGERLLPFLLDAHARRPDLVDARSAAALSILADWAEQGYACEVDMAAPTLFHGWLAIFTREVLVDEGGGLLGELLFEEMDYKFSLVTVKFLTHYLEATAADIDAIEAGEAPFPSQTGKNYFDNSDTEALETRDQVILESLSLALDELSEIYADKTDDVDDLSSYAWGLYHTIWLEDPALEEASSAVYPKPGALFTVDVADYDQLHEAALPAELETTNAPSNRFVFELAPGAIRGAWILPGGQSERPDSEFHNDMLAEYVAGEHRPMRFYLEEVEAGQVERWSVPGGFPAAGAITVE